MTGRSDILYFVKKMGPFYDHHDQRHQAGLARARNQASVSFTAGADYRFFQKRVRILTTPSLHLLRQQKEKRQAPTLGIQSRNGRKEYATQFCRYRKEEKSCNLHCYSRRYLCDNLGNAEFVEGGISPGVPEAAAVSTSDLILLTREELQDWAIDFEATGSWNRIQQKYSVPIRAVNCRGTSQNIDNQPPCQADEIVENVEDIENKERNHF